MIKGCNFILFLLFVLCINASAQTSIDSDSRWVVKLEDSELKSSENLLNHPLINEIDLISERFGLIEVRTTESLTRDKVGTVLKNWNPIRFYPAGAPLTHRENLPDDNLFASQWSMETINMPEVWEFTTGGETTGGDEIVVAVIDDGFDLDHIDLRDNIWINRGEIKDDGLDNDGNGVIDDYKGFNVVTDNDDIPSLSHGTRVAGIIGGKGNNSEGIAGINWNVKILPIGGVNLIPQVMKGMDYIIRMKQLYISSNGERGANILVTNLSLGKDRVFPENFPDWCELYDAAGEVGILNVAAAPNDFYNVDIEGDLPSLCQSDFLITATNTNKSDVLATESALGPINIDLGAPGVNIISTSINNDYRNISGTSGSSPHVAGVAALLFSSCEKLSDLAKSEPASAALVIRDVILNGVQDIPSLTNTATGGRLDAFGSFLKLEEFCSDSESRDLTIISSFQDASNLTVDYNTNLFETHTYVIYNMLGQKILTGEFRPELFEAKQLDIELTQIQSTGNYIITIFNDSVIASHIFTVVVDNF